MSNPELPTGESTGPKAIPTKATDPIRRRPWYRHPAGITGVASLAVATALAIGTPLAITASAISATSPVTNSTQTDTGSRTLYGGSGEGDGTTGGGTSTQDAATTASADESTGIVLIDTVLGYEDARAAGTGMVIDSSGYVLTNNHVVEGSTQITVTIASTGKTYTATVVGTDATDDVALLKLQGASGLDTVKIDQGDTEKVGDAVTAVGNAEGGGVLMAADGTITALDSSVTTGAEGSVAGETLNGVIQIAAQIVSGDSGGALLTPTARSSV